QSPTTGRQAEPPYRKRPASGAPGVSLLRRYQAAVLGLKTPRVLLSSVRSSRPSTRSPGQAPWLGCTFRRANRRSVDRSRAKKDIVLDPRGLYPGSISRTPLTG